MTAFETKSVHSLIGIEAPCNNDRNFERDFATCVIMDIILPYIVKILDLSLVALWPLVINPIYSLMMTITTCDIFQYFSPAIY